MKDTYLQAKLIAKDRIRVGIFSSAPWSKLDASLLVDGKNPIPLVASKTSTLGPWSVVDYLLPSPLPLGHHYHLLTPQFGQIPLDMEEAPSFPGFDEEFTYEGDDLGATYTPKATTFKLWAPVASDVAIKYRPLKKGEKWRIEIMTRKEKGVYEARIEGDLNGYEYLYVVVNSEIGRQVTDPYALASTANGETSVVLDLSAFESIPLPREELPPLRSSTDAIVYEAHVRDFTISSRTNIRHKGKFLGLVEKNRKTDAGNPAGLAHLLALGITHLQLLPIYDYKTVDETRSEHQYNWGYDPAQYFVPEGSYATDPCDPRSRIEECRKMVSALHESRIRVVMDVVFNHVFEANQSVFEQIVPNYYFRRCSDGRRANTSGCGNDLASERPMVRKLIVDACAHWISFYGIDGFRFDLMGILDVETLKAVEKKARSIDPSFLLYGEGWNMGGQVKVPLGHMGNYRELPDFGFFNDTFRETTKRFFAADFSAVNDFKFVFASSSVPFIRSPMFLDARQSVNYIECHDNETYFDILSFRRKDLSDAAKCELVLAASAATILSFGMPFLHMGQEIAASKWGEGNTYNKGDRFNKMSYALLDERHVMVETLARFIAFRKNTPFLRTFDPDTIDRAIFVSDADGCVHASATDPSLIEPYRRLETFFNPTDHDIRFRLYHSARVILTTKEGARIEKEDVVVPARSTVVAGI